MDICVGEHSNFKIFLRTRKIMVMHSNEGESLIYIPLYIAMEALTQRRGSSRTSSSRSDRSKHRYSGTSEFLAHVQLDDNPQAPIQQSVGEEFRQHDGVVTILMFYRHTASPKHRYNMIGVEYGGRGHRTRLRNDLKDQLVCSRVPLPQYIKDYRGEAGRPRCGAPGESYSLWE